MHEVSEMDSLSTSSFGDEKVKYNITWRIKQKVL